MKTAKAKIEWLFEEERIPPVIRKEDRKTRMSYAPIIIFYGHCDSSGVYDNSFSETMWSSVIFNDTIDGKTSIATITYLMDDAPFELLKIDAEFALYEGKEKVAVGKIIGQVI